jgi:hypothetical protein
LSEVRGDQINLVPVLLFRAIHPTPDEVISSKNEEYPGIDTLDNLQKFCG